MAGGLVPTHLCALVPYATDTTRATASRDEAKMEAQAEATVKASSEITQIGGGDGTCYRSARNVNTATSKMFC